MARCWDTCCTGDRDEIVYTVLGRRWVQSAVFEHTCNTCRGIIKRGEAYTRVAVLVDGEFYVEKHHTYGSTCDREWGIYEEIGVE